MMAANSEEEGPGGGLQVDGGEGDGGEDGADGEVTGDVHDDVSFFDQVLKEKMAEDPQLTQSVLNFDLDLLSDVLQLDQYGADEAGGGGGAPPTEVEAMAIAEEEEEEATAECQPPVVSAEEPPVAPVFAVKRATHKDTFKQLFDDAHPEEEEGALLQQQEGNDAGGMPDVNMDPSSSDDDSVVTSVEADVGNMSLSVSLEPGRVYNLEELEINQMLANGNAVVATVIEVSGEAAVAAEVSEETVEVEEHEVTIEGADTNPQPSPAAAPPPPAASPPPPPPVAAAAATTSAAPKKKRVRKRKPQPKKTKQYELPAPTDPAKLKKYNQLVNARKNRLAKKERDAEKDARIRELETSLAERDGQLAASQEELHRANARIRELERVVEAVGAVVVPASAVVPAGKKKGKGKGASNRVRGGGKPAVKRLVK